MAEGRLEEFLKEITEDLDRTMAFWFKYSHDEQYGGFLNCIGPTGEVYDETKHVWFQSRQVWMYARLYNEVERFKKPEILQAAIRAGDFLMKHAKDPVTQKCALEMTRDGKHIKFQRSIFSECFYIMAMSELYRSTKESKYKDESILLMDKIIHWVRVDGTDMRRGAAPLPGVTAVHHLAVPMMLLCVIDVMETADPSLAARYRDTETWALQDTLNHVQRDGTVVVENVTPTGESIPGHAGRLMIPGHAIEAGWFLLQLAIKRNKSDLKRTAIEKFMLNPFRYGWDSDYGGLFYYLDADGLSPVQLMWNMKLWWTHNESLISFLMAYKETRDPEMLEKFQLVFDYCYSKYVDRENGEWAGYLNRNGDVSMDFKGGPWKGCFHVPRALYMCEAMLKDILKK